MRAVFMFLPNLEPLASAGVSVLRWNARNRIPLRLVLNASVGVRSLESNYLSIRGTRIFVRIPIRLIPSLAYFLGIIAGDGSINRRNPRTRGGWKIEMWEGNIEYHKRIYAPLCRKLFGITPRFRIIQKPNNRKNTCSAINSKIIHIYLTQCLGIPSGFKANRITMPRFIEDSPALLVAYLRGLFDTDGTVTGREVRFSTVSPRLFEQVCAGLTRVGIGYYTSRWKKEERFQMLYTLSIKARMSILNYRAMVGFGHPKKRRRLDVICSPVV